MKSMAKILFFLFGGVGGAERMTVNIGKMLPKNRYEVKFVVCGREGKILNFIPSDYEVIHIPWLNIHVFPRTRIGLVIHRERPDFVFSSIMGLNVLLLQVAGLFRVKCVVRNDTMFRFVGKNMIRKVSKHYKQAYKVIAQQEEMQKELIDAVGTDSNHIVCLHNPLDIDNIESKIKEPSPYPKDDAINYLMVGNYLEIKGHDIIAEAFKIVHSRNPKTHLYFVGTIYENAPNYIKTLKIIKDSQLDDFVHFIDHQVNPYKWMKYCDCFVLPSRLEGLPNVLLEAMYLKRPVVASVCIPVIDRMVEEGYNGYKVKPEQPEAMAEAMEKALLLKDFQMTFKTASSQDYVKLFE